MICQLIKRKSENFEKLASKIHGLVLMDYFLGPFGVASMLHLICGRFFLKMKTKSLMIKRLVQT